MDLMLLKSEKLKSIILVFLLVIVSLLTRLPRLKSDIVSTDAVYWHDRAEKFLNALETKEYEDTYQQYHPGVTLMWTTALTAKVYGLINNLSTEEVFSNFELIHYHAKLILVFLQLGLSIYIFYLLSALYGRKLAFFMVALFSLEPFYVGNSRLLHLDAQISLYVLIALLLSFQQIQKTSTIKSVLVGIFLALAVLSKTLFLGALLFSLFVGGILILVKQDVRTALQFFLTVLVTFILTYILLFPAFWVDFMGTFQKIFIDSYEVGNELGHKQIFFGELVRDPGPLFYPVLFLLKVSIVTLLGIVIYLFSQLITTIKNKGIEFNPKSVPFEVYAAIFYIGYFLVLTFFSKKVDRYIVPLYPFFGIISVLGYSKLKFKKGFLVFLLVVYSIIYPLVRAFPHYLTSTNPIIGDAARGNEIIGQKLFGIGVFDLREHIVEEYGPRTKVAMNDYDTLASIYGYDLVFDISSTHPNSYKLIILGPNKELPDSVTNTGIRFTQRSSVYINGLEFWRIFKVRGR